MSVTLQYVIVCVILAVSAIWIAIRFHKNQQIKDSGCLGCDLYDACKQRKNGCTNGDKQGHTRSIP